MSVISPDQIPATGTGTLIIKLEDVNDNAPTVVERDFEVRQQSILLLHIFQPDKIKWKSLFILI